ncbi:transcriptional regulator [Thermoproteus tenax]|uniref:Predicted transcriptional regulator n=1 Tax=Thermoproteus tenax (strain ATCC 35583 / DSM 2078 / JCM 9277 / NBRC 100435 / Kra 1) TaxID=768679 RepID=G4RNI3_THETK|nr:transcriptional regulator [Thermoproteus tenax]CCC81127.1 predicted transcriptional regulator [Thermoproteus tenax Kra 1]
MSLEKYISALRAVVARELVRRGLSVNEAARVLGVTAAAVSLYVSGKRGGELAAKIESNERVMSIVKSYLDAYLERRAGTSLELADLAQAVKNAMEAPAHVEANVHLLIMERIKLEQETANKGLLMVYRSGNPLARSIFMQIAMDSLRHAEILITLLDYLAGRIKADELALTEEELRTLSEEERGMRESIEALYHIQDPLARALIKSIEYDELKHYELVKALLSAKTKGSTL